MESPHATQCLNLLWIDNYKTTISFLYTGWTPHQYQQLTFSENSLADNWGGYGDRMGSGYVRSWLAEAWNLYLSNWTCLRTVCSSHWLTREIWQGRTTMVLSLGKTVSKGMRILSKFFFLWIRGEVRIPSSNAITQNDHYVTQHGATLNSLIHECLLSILIIYPC